MRIIGILLALAAIVAAIGYGSTRLMGSLETGPSMEVSTHTVEKTEMLITVTEDGEVESAHNIDVKCEVAGGSSILSLVEDGSLVRKGDLLVELDSAALEDQINTQKISYNKAKSAVIQAEKDYSVAQISVKEYIEGTFLKEQEDADTQITIAEENLRSAKNALEYSEKMYQRGYISQLELESQQFAVKRAQLELNSANTGKRVLVDFTKAKTLEDLESQVETAKAAMESEQAAFVIEENKLTRLETQIENCKIYAPQDGMAVFVKDRGRFGQSGSSIEEGAALRDRQTILRLPDLLKMQVKVKVHETKVEEIRPGMRARVNIQGRELQGFVTSVANQPESTSFFQGNVKEYATIVKIDGNPDSLKPGMTAEVEILVAHLKDALVVPISAVVEQRSEFYCWVMTDSGVPERRTVTLGLTNDQFVEVKSGIEEGERVVRNPRAMVDEAKESNAEAEEVDVQTKFGNESQNAATPTGPGSAERGPRGERGPGGQRGANGAGPPRGEGAAAGEVRGGGERGGRGRSGRPSMDLMSFDKDGDGKVSKDEAPEQMQSFFDRIDADADGFIDASEIETMRRNRPAGGGPSGGGSGRGGPPE